MEEMYICPICQGKIWKIYYGMIECTHCSAKFSEFTVMMMKPANFNQAAYFHTHTVSLKSENFGAESA